MVRASLVAALVALGSCGGTEPEPVRDSLRQPSGLAVSPNAQWLFVTNGNWDRVQKGGTLAAVDLVGLHAALGGDVGAPGATLSSSRPCRRLAERDPTIECLPTAFIDAEQTVVFGDGLGNIALDTRGAETAGGPYRLLLPQRAPAALAWVDVVPTSEGIDLDCGQDAFGVCDAQHQVRRSEDAVGIGPDPSRVTLDDQGFRFAYVPHLLDGELTLIDLDGELGPEITARTDSEFYRADLFDEFDAAGGFSVAARACDPMAAAEVTAACERPLLYTTHRYWPGIKSFTVAAGLEVILSGNDTRISGIGAENVIARPIMGDLAFEDPALGDRLLLVQTTPGALARVDTSIDPESESPRNTPLGSVALCSNPNILAVHRPPNEEALALVSCLSDGVVAVVGLATFTVVRRVLVGEGANEMVIDAAREQLYVANSRENTVSIVSLDRQSPDFLREWARLGVGAGSRDEP
ncbi:MAG: YncE family protein [Nannocystales bacterium]